MRKSNLEMPPYLASLYERALVNNTGYYDNHLYDINVNEVDNDNRKFAVLIVGRHYYQEYSRSYPIESNKEVKKLVNLEFEGKQFFFRILEQKNNKTNVKLWVMNDYVPKAWVMIPESILLAELSEESSVLSVDINLTDAPKALFVAKNRMAVHSQVKTNLIQSPEHLLMANGIVAEHTDVLSFDAQSYGKALIKALLLVPVSKLLPFVRLPKQNELNLTQVLRGVFAPVAAVFCVYMLAVSGWLMWQHKHYQSFIDAKTSNLNAAFTLQDRLSTNQQLITQYQSTLSGKRNLSPIWLIMADGFERATYSRLNFSKGRFVLRGSTEKATELLDFFTNHQLIKEAKFDNPTRTSRNKEIFTISFTLKDTSNAELLAFNSTPTSSEKGNDGE